MAHEFIGVCLDARLTRPATAQVLPKDTTNGPNGDARPESVLESTAEPEPFLLFFVFDSDKLTVASEVTVAAAVKVARMLGVTEFAVTGHANEARSAEYNMELSLRRASAAREALIASGIASARISVAGRISLSLPHPRTRRRAILGWRRRSRSQRARLAPAR